MNHFEADDWRIALPAGWQGQRDEDCDLLFDPQGPGTLELRALLKDRPVDDEDLYDLAAEDLDAGATIGDVEHGDFTGFTYRYREDGVYWRQWRLRSGVLALAISYACAVEDAERQDEAVDDLLDGLEAMD